MALSLASLRAALAVDPGLNREVSAVDMNRGLAAVDQMSAMLIRVIEANNLNDDKLITAADMAVISHAVRFNATDYWAFVEDHGDDEGGIETGYHRLQNDGSSLTFQGRNLADTIADAIFHFGFNINATGRFVNEDGNENEQAADVAGWLNYFLNGKNVVHGNGSSEELYSGAYSPALARAANETFLAGAGNDSIWAGDGNDSVLGGLGNDKSGGQNGNDTVMGEAGNDSLYGDAGSDLLNGGIGNDVIGGGAHGDRILGGAGRDMIYGETGSDQMFGDAGMDTVYGGAGNDHIQGGAADDSLAGDDGNDSLFGEDGHDKIYAGAGLDSVQGGLGNDTIAAGEGRDVIWAGAGADTITLWENVQSSDRLIFKAGDSGKARATIDHVEGFQSGVDVIDLRSYAGMVLEDLDYRGGGTASVYFDGRHLRLDGNGDAVTDMIVEFKWQDDLTARDFMFA